MATTAITFEGETPILRVRDLRASIDHYVRILGFKFDWEGPGPFAAVTRDRCHVFLYGEWLDMDGRTWPPIP